MKEEKTETTLDDIINEQLKDPEFAEAWSETEMEDQIKRSIVQARIDAGLTQTELAKRAGIRQSNISRIENGTAIPTLQTLNAIARGIGKKLKITFE
ncbi:MAG: helix-turn-helix domain-containing protein [Erysipelotrichaceae bacterium]|nr:helix-turn-helix domain-containing protein [Erysipelotrichaceae bacterium]